MRQSRFRSAIRGTLHRRPPGRHRAKRQRKVGQQWAGVLTLAVSGASFGVLSAAEGTFALWQDAGTAAPVTATGGTLDIAIDEDSGGPAVAGDGPGTFSFSASVSSLRPGDTAYADVAIVNTGSLKALIDVTTTGSDSHSDYPAIHCFSYFFRERQAGGDVLVHASALGTSESNAGVVSFHANPGSVRLYDDSPVAIDPLWEANESKTFRLTVRMTDQCVQGGQGTEAATGSLGFTFAASHV